MAIKTKGLIEQHIHGAFGVNFNTAGADEIVDLSIRLLNCGVFAFFPTLYTDSTENLKIQINGIKQAQQKQPINSSKITGIHLEGPFINPKKKGIHNEKQILLPTIDNYKLLEDEIIKIVTLAPELDHGFELCKYLKSKNIKVSAGHTLAVNLSEADQVTHLFNAMGTIHHKQNSTATEALVSDDIYIEVIADSVHIDNEVLKLVFKSKPKNKIILISDALPLTHSDLEKIEFSSETIYLKNGKALSDQGTLAGSAMLLADIVKNLALNKLLSFEDAVSMASDNISNYHNLNNNCDVFWDENYNIIDVKLT